MTILIDYGASFIKYVIIKNNIEISKGMIDILNINTKHNLENATKKIFIKEKINLEDVECFKVTGSKASFLGNTLFGKKIILVNEFDALSKAIKDFTNLKKFIVVNSGTGTSILYVNNKNVTHIGGTGLGGGTIKGILRENSIEKILQKAKGGSINNTDILIKDISKHKKISHLDKNTACSNLGKFNSVNHGSNKEKDYAVGVLNMVYQNIGVCAVLASNAVKEKNIVFAGNTISNNFAIKSLKVVEKLFNKKFYFIKEPGFVCVRGCK